MSLPHYQKTHVTANISLIKFLNYAATKVLPLFDQIDEALKVSLVQAIADTSPFADGSGARTILPSIYSLLMENIHLTQTIDLEVATGAEGKEEEPKEKPEEKDINFNLIEALLYAFQNFLVKSPSTMKELSGIVISTGQPSDTANIPENAHELTAAYKQKLGFLQKQANLTAKKLSGVKDNKTEEITIALNTTKSIEAMVKNLSKPTVSTLKEQVRVSWKGTKRKNSEKDFESALPTNQEKKKPRGEIYVPPKRQFNYARGGNRGFSGRGRGGRGNRRY